MIQTLQDKKIVVTGAASGVGAALVASLRNLGAYVIGLDVRESSGACQEFHVCNLAESASIDTFTATLKTPIYGLANVAGVPGSASLELVAKVNFLGLRHLTRGLLPQIEDGGVVINVASTAGGNWRANTERITRLLQTKDWDEGLSYFQDTGLDAIAGYDFSKEAVILFTQLVASQERHRGIRVNSVSPGAVQTPILKDFYNTMGSELLDKLKRQAGGRDAKPEEIASAISLLMLPGFFWMNGADLILDGGAEVLMNLDQLAVAPAPFP